MPHHDPHRDSFARHAAVRQPGAWPLVLAAAAGESTARERFARVYLDVVREFLRRRWQGTTAVARVADATQEVFVDIFRDGGVLDRVRHNRIARNRTPSFQAFLYGVTRNVARRFEARTARRSARTEAVDLDALHSKARSQAREYDRAWALSCVAEARRRLARAAETERQHRRIALLNLRYREGMPIRDIAAAWDQAPDSLHHEHATARREFHRALRATLASRGLGGDLDEACRMLMSLIAG